MTKTSWHRSIGTYIRNSAAALAIVASLTACGFQIGRAAQAFEQLAAQVQGIHRELVAVRAALNSLARKTCRGCRLPPDPPKRGRGL